jgi:hypothetical protein
VSTAPQPSARTWGLVIAAYFGLAVAMTHPLFVRMGDHVLITPIDNLLNTWILAWDYHALASHPLRLFDANIFYPARDTLALSEHLLGDLVLFAPVMWATGNPLLAANAVVFGSFVLSGLAMFALAWHWTRSVGPSFVAGFVFAFAPPRIGQIGKWQLLSVQWAPLALLFLDRFLDSRRWRDGLLAAGCFTLQVLSSFYLGYALAFVMVAYVVYRLVADRGLWSRELVPRGLGCAALAAAVILPTTLPYLRLKRDSGLLFSPAESYAWASTDPLLSFLSVPDYGTNPYQALLARFQPAGPWESWLFPGVLPVVLVLIALVAALRARAPVARWDRHTVGACLVIALVPLVLSLGPVLVLNERITGVLLPYALFSAVLPGFSTMRAPARFALMAWVGFSVLAGFGVQALARALAGWVARRGGEIALVSALVLLLAVELRFAPLPMDPVETGARVPPVYRWLATQPRGGAVLEVPWAVPHGGELDPRWRGKHWLLDHDLKWTVGHRNLLLDWITRAQYTYFSVYHWHPIVNGYSGYTPPAYEAVIARLGDFPSPESAEFLGRIGVRWVVVHRARLDPTARARWASIVPAQVGLTPVAEFDDDLVYRTPGR